MTQTTKQNEDFAELEILTRQAAAEFLGINAGQLDTMVGNGEIKTHSFNSGRSTGYVFFRSELMESKARLDQIVKERQDKFGKAVATYNLSRMTRDDVKQLLEDQKKMVAHIDRLFVSIQGLNTQLADLRNRLDSVREVSQRSMLASEKVATALVK